MEREQWHIFYLKVTSLIAIVTFLIVTLYLAVVFGNYYAIYETQYSVKLELHEIQRTYLSQYIYICYLGCLIICDLIAFLAILFNLNYIILFDIFHHLTLLLVKIYSGFELNIPGEHSFGILGLFIVLHTTIIIALSLLYRKLESVSLVREILREQIKANAGQNEQRRLSDRDQLNNKLMNEYQQKYLSKSGQKTNDTIKVNRKQSATVELEPVDIEQDFDTIKQNLKIQRQNRTNNNDPHHQTYANQVKLNSNRTTNKKPDEDNQIYKKSYKQNYGQNKLNTFNRIDQSVYDSDGYLKAIGNREPFRDDELSQLNRNRSKNENDNLISNNKQNQIVKHCRSYSVDDESTDIYFEPDDYVDDYMENVYDYLKCDIDKSYYTDEYLKRSKINNGEQNDRSINQLNTNKLPCKQLIDKSVQTNQSNSSNETAEVFYTANEKDFCYPDSNFSTGTSGLIESYQKSNQTKSRKIEYSTLKYDHKILYETSV